MRWTLQVVTCLVFHAAVVRGFSQCLRASSSLRRGRSSLNMANPAPGLWERRAPLGLGSWRVESVVDSQEPNSMFVFLFDDGSGESGVVQDFEI